MMSILSYRLSVSLAALVMLFFAGLFMSSCATLPPPTVPPATSSTAVEPVDIADGPATAIAQALIESERNASISGDLATLEQLWTNDARIVDGRSTEAPTDDMVWSGRKAILDRYTLAVIPAPPPPLDEGWVDQLSVQEEADRIIATIGVDTWTFVNQDGQWRIQELRYN